MKKIIILSVFGMLLMVTYAGAFQGKSNVEIEQSKQIKSTMSGYIDITPNEAWEMMSTSEDGVQIPIDVRRLDEYINERIILPDTDEFIRWFPYELESDGPGPIKNEGFLLQFFMNLYKDKEIIIYCRTGRRTGISAQILVDNGFSVIVYNVVGGISAWKTVGLPTTKTL
jgi:rhodanese-related sulfurtransferase